MSLTAPIKKSLPSTPGRSTRTSYESTRKSTMSLKNKMQQSAMVANRKFKKRIKSRVSPSARLFPHAKLTTDSESQRAPGWRRESKTSTNTSVACHYQNVRSRQFLWYKTWRIRSCWWSTLSWRTSSNGYRSKNIQSRRTRWIKQTREMMRLRNLRIWIH